MLIRTTPYQEQVARRQLEPADKLMLDALFRDSLVGDQRPLARSMTACEGFYLGCTCDGCEGMEEYHPACWPRLRRR